MASIDSPLAMPVSGAGRKRVPAVDNALAILLHLRDGRNAPCTLSEIARATSINLSTCFNLSKTVEAALALRYDEVTRTDQLDPLRGELGRLVDDHLPSTARSCWWHGSSRSAPGWAAS